MNTNPILDTQTLNRLIYQLKEVDSTQLTLEYFYSKSLEEPVSASTIKRYLEELHKTGKLEKVGKTRYGDDVYRLC